VRPRHRGSDPGHDLGLLALDRRGGVRTLRQRLAVQQRDQLDEATARRRRPSRGRTGKRQHETGRRENE
jgi:hypothetical protein